MRNKLRIIFAILLFGVISTEVGSQDACLPIELKDLNLTCDIPRNASSTSTSTSGQIYKFAQTAASWARENRKASLALALFILLCVWSFWTMNFTRAARMLRKFPNTPKIPIIGSLPFIAWRPEDIATSMNLGIWLFGRRFVFWFGHKPMVTILEADGVQKVLSSTKYIEKGSVYKQLHWLMGNGLITSNGQMWREDRKLLSPSFKYQRYDGFLETFNRHSKILVDILSKRFTNDYQKMTDLHPYLARATMDFIVEAALGQTSNCQNDLDSKFFDAVKKTLTIIRTRVTKPFLTLPIIWGLFGMEKDQIECTTQFSDMIEEVLIKRRELLASGDDGLKSGTKPFIDPLMNYKSDADIKSHIVTIYGAGFETTASGMNFTLFLLALNPECQAKVHEELDRVLGTEDEDLTFDHLSELKYLEMCIKESLRLFPPAPLIFRHANEDIVLDEKQTIPKGSDIVFPIYHIHRDAAMFPRPRKFIPERFLPDACASRHPYAYIPFSSGPRNCLGLKYAMMQMKTTLAHILRKFSVTTSQRRQDIKVAYGLVLETKPNLEMILTPRENVK